MADLHQSSGANRPNGAPSEPNGPHRSRRESGRRTTRRMVTCAIFAALSVVILGIGTVLEIIDLTAAALAAVIILLLYLCYGARYAFLTYAVTGVLGAVLMPQSLAAWTYIGLMGYYPVLKQKLDRLPRPLAWLIKLCLFAAVMAGCLLIFHFILYGGQGSILDTALKLFGEEGTGKPALSWAILGLSLVTFVIFDLLLGRICILYHLRFKRQIDKWMKP